MRFFRLLPLLVTPLLMSQTAPERPGPPPMDAVKAVLGLTDEQVTQLRDLRRQEFEALRPISQQLREKRRALGEALRSDSSDTTQIAQLLVDMKALREQIRQSNQSFHDKAVALLTPDQAQKLESLEAARNLAPAIRQATGLNLLLPPERPEGAGLGPGPAGGPGGLAPRGMRFGRGPRR